MITYETRGVNVPFGSVEITLFDNGEKIFEYVRNYSHLNETIKEFAFAGKRYVMFSADYTTTSILDVETREVVASEEPDSFGFCPLEYYKVDGLGLMFVLGCVWGCDEEICAIDLSDMSSIRYIYDVLPEYYPPEDFEKLSDLFEDISDFSRVKMVGHDSLYDLSSYSETP